MIRFTLNVHSIEVLKLIVHIILDNTMIKRGDNEQTGIPATRSDGNLRDISAYGYFAIFTCPNTNTFFKRNNENFTITDFS